MLINDRKWKLDIQQGRNIRSSPTTSPSNPRNHFLLAVQCSPKVQFMRFFSPFQTGDSLILNLRVKRFRLSVAPEHETGTKLIIPTPISAFAKFFARMLVSCKNRCSLLAGEDNNPFHQEVVLTEYKTILSSAKQSILSGLQK